MTTTKTGQSEPTGIKHIEKAWFEAVGCKWPECNCKVPYWAFSHHNRKAHCLRYRIEENLKWIEENPGYGCIERLRENEELQRRVRV